MKCERKGWTELDDRLERDEQVELWELVAAGNQVEARELVAAALDRDDEEICGVDMIAEPCELLIDWSCYRIWIKEC